MVREMPERTTSLAVATVLVAILGLQQLHRQEEKKAMNVKRITPVLFVSEIEPVLPFWVDKLGFTKTIEVPHGNKIGFVSLEKGSTGESANHISVVISTRCENLVWRYKRGAR